MKEDFCCKKITFFLEEGKVSISYNPKFREFSIDLRNSGSKQIIYYCPWCGSKFPSSLRDLWFDELEKLNIHDPEEQEELIPEEFFTDKWWKKETFYKSSTKED